ncbi:amidohydrolase [Luteipulveratus mongoliensis]|uniref:Amidohydrolase n=1 Tax=Luteipulveratus mongoliensis TaxID=571913 RepID=A0A0K1JNB0_9MICO|nr:amidohydrolase [Luteipulveratus mongoliensis]AKU18075.1 amidohydrolase [Luteipulveratus mongoliensis]
MPRVLFRHRRIITGGSESAPVTGLLVEGETIIATGTAETLAADADTVVDLPGAAVLPGLYDAHIHTANLARDLVSVDMRRARSLDEALDLLRTHVAGLPQDAWIFGGRWDSNKWQGSGRPDRYALDRVAPGRKIALPSIDGHSIWSSSAALAEVGYTRGTPDPAGGQIVRDEHGEPTGITRESANQPFRAVMDDPSTDALDPLLRACQNELLSVGLTSIHDIDGEDCRASYLRMKDAGDLAIRVHKAVPIYALERAIDEGRRTGDGDDWFSTGPVKLFGDGALGSHTAYLTDAYNDSPGDRGISVTSPDDLLRLTRLATRAGIAVATHAIGDAAAAQVVDAYEKVLAEGPLPLQPNGIPLRLRIEHAQHLRPTDIERMARLGIVASMQPTHCTSDIDLADKLLDGHDIASYAWATLLRAGVPLAFGSDAPVEEPAPIDALYAAVSRQRPDGTPPGGWQPSERLTFEEALAAHTVGSAYAAGQDDRKGRLVAGQLADLVCVDADPTDDRDPTIVRDLNVLLTMVGGQTRWEAPTG